MRVRRKILKERTQNRTGSGCFYFGVSTPVREISPVLALLGKNCHHIFPPQICTTSQGDTSVSDYSKEPQELQVSK